MGRGDRGERGRGNNCLSTNPVLNMASLNILASLQLALWPETLQ